MARQNVYRIFEKDSIDIILLKKIGAILDHDFLEYFTNQQQIAQSTGHLLLSEKNIELQKDNDRLKNELMLATKEIDYLKKIIELMEERTKLLFANK